MTHLTISYLDDRTETVELPRAQAVIGREAGCDVPLADGSTSRRHAHVYRDDEGRYWVEDLHSKNGTFMRGQRITKARLRSGDAFEIGACTLRLVVEDEPTIVLRDNEAATLASSAWAATQRLELPRRRLETLYELNERLTGRFDRDDLLGEVLDICVEALRLERAGIGVWRGPGHEVEWIKLRDTRAGAPGEFCISRSIVQRALHNSERTLINDTGEIDPTASMATNNIRSAMCVPMVYLQQVHGVIYGDRVTSTGGYTREDIDFFAALGRLGAMGLANVQLVEEIHGRRQVELQLQWGRQIQAHLFPAEPLVRPGLTIDALNEPGQKISGDYYDYFQRDDGRVVAVIADVSGKGIPASLLTANLQAAVRLMLATETDLVRAVTLLNQLICRNVSDGRFITAVVGLLDVAAKTWTYVNAGHPVPLVLRAGGEIEKPSAESGLPLGVEPQWHYEASTLKLDGAPTTLFLFTDGVSEAENEKGEMFREERLLDALRASAARPPEELLTAVRRAIRQFTRDEPQSDDITMLAIRLG
jgi:sigma-B regulation protein RsbU (phosphoserine phosphatase)